VTDSDAHCIRNVTPDGIVITYAGTELAAGNTDGLISRVSTITKPTRLVGNNDSSGYAVIFDSSDGDTWNDRSSTVTFGPYINTITCGYSDLSSGALYYGGNMCNVPPYTSETYGTIWRQASATSGLVSTRVSVDRGDVYSMAYNGSNLFVAAGNDQVADNAIYVSEDGGSSWSESWTNLLNAGYSVVYAANRWVAGALSVQERTSFLSGSLPSASYSFLEAQGRLHRHR
jgi:hypothetical protein